MDPTPAVDAPTAAPGAAAPRPSVADWFRQNATQLAVVAAVVGLVCYYLHPLDVLIAGGGMSLIIFLHELGHFAAAKLCDVHVKTFSIGFGPALPFCSFKYGETTYKLAVIPLGGFVSMVGEGDDGNDVSVDEPDGGETPAEAADPRNLKNKSVLQRMVIISAGVVMNVLLAACLFVATYLHGVEEKPGVVAQTQVGGAAWTAGIHSGTEVKRINGRVNPWFDDIRPIVSSTSAGETVELVTSYRGQEVTRAIEPTRQEGSLFPLLGVLPAEKLQLRELRRDPAPPFESGSAAAAATGPDGGFKPGDRLVAMSDPDAPGNAVTPFRADADGMPGEYFDYFRRMTRLAEKPVEVRVVRKGDTSNTPVAVRVPPELHYDLGLVMQMGPVAAVRTGSPADVAGVRAELKAGDKAAAGDRIVSVTVAEPGGKRVRFTADPEELKQQAPGLESRRLDPVRLAADLDRWAARQTADRAVELTVLRDADHTRARTVLKLTWDDSYRYEPPGPVLFGTPMPVNGLGLAFHAEAVVAHVDPAGPAAAAGLKPADKVTRVMYKILAPDGKPIPQKWADVQPQQWGFVWGMVQAHAPHGVELEVERDGQKVTADLTGTPTPDWGQADRGLALVADTKLQKANSVGEALSMGVYRTGRAITMTYQNLYATVFGRISVLALSGPITMARASYLIAGEDVWHLMLWMALISINLAVVNFLPVPVLDGGHMVFLTYEAIRGKPAPVPVQNVLTFVGLGLIGCLMLFVLGLDLWRLWGSVFG